MEELRETWIPNKRMIIVLIKVLIESVELIIIHISIWNVSFSILIGQNSVAEWLSG